MVLVEGTSKRGDGMVTGRTSGNKVVNFIGGPELVSSIVPVRIVRGFANSLQGEPLNIH